MESITNKEDTRFKSGKITLENGLTPHKTRKLPDTPPAGEADPRQLARRPEQLPLKVQEQFVKRKRASHKRSRSLTGFQVEDNGEQELVRKESSEISKLHVIADKAPASESPSSQLTVQESVTVPKVPRSLPASPGRYIHYMEHQYSSSSINLNYAYDLLVNSASASKNTTVLMHLHVACVDQ